jgi:hypothetical protein
MPRERLISASEIGEYLFCRRAWWLHRVVGIEPAGKARRDRGVALHARHGRHVQLSQLALGSAVAITLIALLLLLT